MALKWAITDRFHEYSYGGVFEVFTDNNLLTYILTSAKLDATGQRWEAALSIYDFQIFYRSGKSNKNADALSRIPWEQTDTDKSKKMDAITVKAVMTKTEDACIPLGTESVVSMAAQFFSPDYAQKMNITEWRREQEKDQAIGKLLSLMEEDMLFKYRSSKSDDAEVQNYLKTHKSLCLVHYLLHRQVQLKHHQTMVHQFVLPKPFRKRMVMAYHDEMGHLGMDRTLLLLQDPVYWPGMGKDVTEHIRTCKWCGCFKERPNTEAIQQTEAEYPLEKIHVNFLVIGGKKDPRKDINVLVVTDHFARFVQAYVTTSHTAVTVAKVMFERFFTQYGWPTKLITDQGPQFEGNLFQQLMPEAQIRKIRTTPYHPEGNAQCEKFNRTLLEMLGSRPIKARYLP